MGHFNSILAGHPEYKIPEKLKPLLGALGHGFLIATGIAISLKITKIKFL